MIKKSKSIIPNTFGNLSISNGKSFFSPRPLAFALLTSSFLAFAVNAENTHTPQDVSSDAQESAENLPDYINKLYTENRQKGLFDYFEIRHKRMSGFAKWMSVLKRSKMPDDQVIMAARTRKKASSGRSAIRLPKNYDPSRLRKLAEARKKAAESGGDQNASEMKPLCTRKNRVKCRKNEWDKFVDAQIEAKRNGATDKEILSAVNLYMNETPYIVDPTNWGVPDYWATTTEFFYKDGDCEDYAISKYVTLARIGYSKKAMRLVIGQDNNSRVEHAVLAVRIEDGEYILDNQVKAVLEQSRIRHFTPVYAINESAWWRFAKKLYN